MPSGQSIYGLFLFVNLAYHQHVTKNNFLNLFPAQIPTQHLCEPACPTEFYFSVSAIHCKISIGFLIFYNMASWY